MADLHVGPGFNPEEAAHVAAEFIASKFVWLLSERCHQGLTFDFANTLVIDLDSLPGEVAYLLQEIRDKDLRITRTFLHASPNRMINAVR